MKNIHKIYVFHTGVFCKIGVTSRKVEDRLKEIQTSCPLPIYAYTVFSNLSKGNAYHIENELKKYLSPHLTFGEWYKEFENITKSVSYVAQAHTNENFNVFTYSTELSKFEDLSIRKLNEIKLHLKDNNLEMMSKMYTDMAFNKDYNETRFFMYSKTEVVKQLEIAIRNTIKYYSKSNIDISSNLEESLRKANSQLSKDDVLANVKEKEKVLKTKVKPKNIEAKLKKVHKNYPFLFQGDN